MQASNIYINTYVSWILNNNFTYFELNCLIQIVENKVIVSRPSHCRILPHILNPLPLTSGPVTFIFGTTRFVCVHRLFDVSVIMTSNSFCFVKFPTNCGQSVFVQVEVKFFYLSLFDPHTSPSNIFSGNSHPVSCLLIPSERHPWNVPDCLGLVQVEEFFLSLVSPIYC